MTDGPDRGASRSAAVPGPSSGSASAATSPGPAWRACCVVVAVVLGAALAAWGAVAAQQGPRVGGVLLSLGVLLTAVLVPLCVRLTAVAARSRAVGAVLLVGWLATTLQMSALTSEGSILLLGDTTGLAVLLAGSLLGGLTAGVVRLDPRRRRRASSDAAPEPIQEA